ncbi:MAG: hypothetical protein IJI03_01075, partial [Rudaea sp.]|nr:hypothetical protein [Rudaea sp.]
MLAPTLALAQVSISAVNTAYTQDFNSLASSGTTNTWTDNSTLPGWYYTRSPTAAAVYSAGNGSSNTGSLYSFGVAGVNPATDRALGSVASGSNTYYYGVRLVNNTGVAITSLAIKYTGEEWRVANATAQKLQFQYQIGAAGTVTGINAPTTGWTAYTALDFTSPVTNATAAALDGNDPANRTNLSSTLTVNIPAGQEIWLRWVDIDDPGSDDGLAIDDFSVTANPSGGASTNPAATGTATPNTASPGDAVTLSIKVTPGTNPASTFTSPSAVVAADISAIVPGATNQAFTYSSTDGLGNLSYTFSATIDPGTATGTKSLPITVTDDQSRTAAATAISISVRTVTPATIMDIQGHGSRSSYAGTGTTLGTAYIRTPTTGRQNIVTAVGPAGFFMQDAQGDNDLTTSDGIYVYTGSGSAPAVAVGDSVVVVGRIQEFSGSTEIAGGPSYTVLSSGNPVPAAYDLSLNLPNTDSSSGICTGTGSNIVVPSADGQTRNDGYQAANFACLDGMLVTMSNGTVNAPTYTTANSGITPSPATPNSGFYAVAGDARSFRKAGILANDANRTVNRPTFWGAPELVQVYYPGLGVTPASLPQAANMPAGGIYSGGQKIRLTGIIQGYQSATMPDPTYELYPRTGADLQLVGDPTYPVAVPDPTAGKLRVGTQNMLHFFNASFDGVDTSVYTDRCLAQPSDVAGNLSGLNTPLAGGADDTCPTPAQYQTRLSKMSLQIRTILKAPTVQVVQEAENLTVMRDLAAKIQGDDSSIAYQPYLLKGNDPGGINIGIFVRAGVTVNSVTQLYLNTTTSACSSGTSCLLNDRPPVLLDAEYQGYHFRVLAIYDRSLGSLGAAGKDYVGQKRRVQAEQVACIVQALQTTGMAVDCDPAAPGSAAGNARQDSAGNVTSNPYPITGDATTPVIVLGDFNAYEFSDGYVDVTGTIMGTVDATASHSVYPPSNGYVRPTPVMFDTGSTVAQAQHYSYNFGGYLQEIDHILLTDVGKGDFVSVDSGRGNSDTSVASLTLTQPGTAVRTSDHDGQVVTLGWVVTPNSTGSGSITPSTVQTVSTTKAVVFTVTPATGNQATVTDNCGNAGAAAGTFNSATNTYTIPPGVKSDCQVSATFGTIPSYTVTTTLSGTGGSISAPAQSPVQQGQSTTFTVSVLTGYSIASVTGDTCSPSVQSGSTYTTGAITANCTITASFTANAVNGACGTDNGQTLTVAPTNLCSAGTASVVTGN